MGCSLAMALLALCPFTLGGEPVSPHAMAVRDAPARDMQDWRAGGAYSATVMGPPSERIVIIDRHGRVIARPRG